MGEAEASETPDSFATLSRLCNHRFWDVSEAWESWAPERWMCAERTLLAWMPCFYLWLIAPFYFLFIRRRPYDPLPWTPLTSTKVVVSFLFLVVSIVELMWAALDYRPITPPVHFITPLIVMATQCLHIGFVILDRRNGQRSSGVLWIFWFLVLFCGIPQIITTFDTLVHKDGNGLPLTLVVTFLLQYLSTLTIFIANCFCDEPSKSQRRNRTKFPSPEMDASFPNKIFYFWCKDLIWKGWRRPITEDDLWDTLHKNETHVIHDAWETATQREQKTHKDVMVKMEKKAENLYDNNIGSDCRAEPISLGWGIWRLTRFDLFIAFLLYVVAEGTYFITPLLLGLLIQFVTDLNEVSWHGYLYAVSMLLVCQISSIIRNQYYQTVLVLSVRVHSALMTAVYRKTLSLSGSARRESTLGQIVNIMAVDSDSIGDVYFYSGVLLGSPLVILVSLGLLWQRLGPSVLAGLGVLLLIIPLNSLLANKCKDIQTLASKIRDKRVKMVSEIVNGIKVLKLYAWEASFASKVEAVRKEEIALMRRKALIQAFSFFLFQASPYLVSLATFSTYLLVSEENILDAETAFVAISLFNIMRLPIVQMPGVISGLVQANVALKRMQKYISSEELDPNAVCSDPSADSAVVVRGGNFQWEGDEQNWYLRDINFKVDEGHLVAIVGSVGAGKSSLISALLGEMKKDSGKVIINGTLAYVSQQAWLQNATLRDNITWGQPFNETRYKEVVHACALKQDLDMLPAGDMTEIGEKGINLSGGQKQRVALARAVYSEADIFLLDDPLSAVDAHVGRHIFDQAIGPKGILQGRTRVLVTHAVTYLPQVDQVLVVQDGRLVEKGSYTELVAKGEDFANFVLQHINTDNDEDQEELAELIDQLEVVPGGQALLRQISHQSSRGSESIVMKSPDGNPSTNHRYRSISECDPRQQRHYPQVPPRPSPNDSCPTANGHLLASTGDDEESRSIASLHSMALELDIANGSASVIPHSEAAENTLGNGSLTHMEDPKRHQRCDLISYKAIDSETDKKVEPGDSGRKLVDEEYVETGKVAQKIYIDYAKAMGVAFAILPVIFLFLAQASVAGANTWLSHWASSQTPIPANTKDNTTNTDVVGRDMFLFVYGALGLSQAFFLYMGVSVVLLGCLRGSRVLHQSLLDAVVHFPMSFFDTNPSGRIINRFSKEINVLDVKLSSTIRSTISTLTKVVTTLVVLIAATPAVTVFILPIMVVYYFIQVVFVATSRQLKRIASLTRPPIYTHFSETIQGLSVIRAYRKQEEFFQESLQRIGHYLKATFVNLNVERWLAVQLEMIGNLITFAASIVAVAGRETISPGLVGLTVTYALNITGMMNWLVRVVSDLEAHIVSVERIIEYVKKDQEAPWVVSSHRPPLDWPQEGGVQFNNYETRYRPGLELVLKGITCSFRPSEKVGIVGRTGAGKSSLTLALFRLIESAGGNIHIDDVTISKLGLHDLRSRISIIPQDPVLFSGTVRLNLDPFDNRSDADIWQALELAHLSDYIRSQPLGLQHVVDEDGSNFSVGQRQLMCLARALLRSSQVLVLDEATAAVDLETDDLIQTTIRNQFAHCTVLTIAHRLNTIMDSDRVLVLDMGKIAEFDTPAALLQNTDSLFHGMAKDAGLI